MSSQSVHEVRFHVELITVYEVCRTLCSSLDIRHSFHVALNILASHLGLQRVMLALPDHASQLRIHSSAGLSEEQIQRGLWQCNEGVVGHVFSSGMPLVISDVCLEPVLVHRTGAFNADEEGLTAFVAVPLKIELDVHGVLAARRELHGNTRLVDDQRILTMIASLLAQALLLHKAVASEHQRLQQEAASLHKALQRERPERFKLDHVIGHSKPMQRVFAEVHQAAPAKATVLLRGESGTGKEVIAQAVHKLSPRKDGPFVAVNCAAISETLLESELFGHERGAFTGAIVERKGRFEQAHRGTLFLDEIGDISAAFQAKLLRVLQEREFERVGGNRTVCVDVRLICATNRDLEAMVQRGDFRSDLYYRINVIPIYLPALRERRADIPALVDHFIARFNEENRRHVSMTPQALNILMNCQWPGNVRELQNCIERAATMAQGDAVQAGDVACEQNRCLTKTLNHFEHRPGGALEGDQGADGQLASGQAELGSSPSAAGAAPLDERERLIWAMKRAGSVQAKAARLLNLTPRQLSYALHKHGIDVHKF
jgi:Nif-specific regulatory protein